MEKPNKIDKISEIIRFRSFCKEFNIYNDMISKDGVFTIYFNRTICYADPAKLFEDSGFIVTQCKKLKNSKYTTAIDLNNQRNY